MSNVDGKNDKRFIAITHTESFISLCYAREIVVVFGNNFALTFSLVRMVFQHDFPVRSFDIVVRGVESAKVTKQTYAPHT